MDIYIQHHSRGLRWHTTRYAHYITIFCLQINIRRPQ